MIGINFSQIVTTLAIVLGVGLLGYLGQRFLEWIGKQTQSTRDDKAWNIGGWIWRVLALLAGVSMIVSVWGIALEPFLTWGTNLLDWAGSRGPISLMILVGVLAAYRYIPRFLQTVPLGGEDGFHRNHVRRRTLVTVIESAVKVVIVVIGFLLILSNLGLNITALLAGAGVVGLGISLAAQNIIRDVLNGFFILLEDQYGVGDVITVGDVSGGVEKFNLRITVLRNLEGKVHIIPNSNISQVTIMSRDWSRSVLDISVAYEADIDRAIAVITDEAEIFKNDPLWAAQFTPDGAQVLGVQALADSAVVVRVMFTTLPKEQWDVGREFLRRIKNRFQKEGIQIPYNKMKIQLEQVPTSHSK